MAGLARILTWLQYEDLEAIFWPPDLSQNPTWTWLWTLATKHQRIWLAQNIWKRSNTVSVKADSAIGVHFSIFRYYQRRQNLDTK